MWAVAMCVAALFAGCSKEEVPQAPEQPSVVPALEITEESRLLTKARQFVFDYTSEAYLWNPYINDTITQASADTPQELFELMRYKELDSWSYVAENSAEAMESYRGVSTTFGYSLTFGRFSNMADSYFAVIEFVYEDSPAQAAGLRRGDIIVSVNGADITKRNYQQLYYGSTISIGTGEIHGNTISSTGVEIEITAVKMYEDPVVAHNVIECAGKKVGYLMYAGFLTESHARLVEVFNEFKEAGVEELILDLRYNLGGNAKTPPYLASMIAPRNVVRNKSVFLREIWNPLYTAYYQSRKIDMNVYFQEDIDVNLNLERVFVLTTPSTASASEATIVGLMPYMQVVKIGETSYGKYCGAVLLTPTDATGKEDKEISNWLLSLVIYKFANKDGYTDFKDGITPDYMVPDSGMLAAIPLGNPEDPMIAKALSLIEGTKSPVQQKGCVVKGVEMLPEFSHRAFRGGYYTVGIK